MNNQQVALPLSQEAIDKAQLPALYVSARNALQACLRVDECRGLQDKFTAIARYAKQSQNEELRVLANKIALRAERRIGELLDEIPKSRVKGQGRVTAVKASGLKANVAWRAMAIAKVPEKEFEAVVESDHPPTREAYANTVRRKSRVKDNTLKGLTDFVRFTQAHPVQSLSLADPATHAAARLLLLKAQEWIRDLAYKLTEEKTG